MRYNTFGTLDKRPEALVVPKIATQRETPVLSQTTTLSKLFNWEIAA
jgi:hypothetical protein